MRRVFAGMLVGGMLALVPAITSAFSGCTITGTPKDDVFVDRPYRRGVVICGGGGNDTVAELAGATFRGGGGHDRVELMTAGSFRGGKGSDTVGTLEGGTFRGGAYRSRVGVMSGGTFDGSRSSDVLVRRFDAGRIIGSPVTQTWVGTMNGGTLIALEAPAYVGFLNGGKFYGGPGDYDAITFLNGGSFEGGSGPDLVDQLRGGEFDGGIGQDTVRSFYGGVFDGGPSMRDQIAICVDVPPATYHAVEIVPDVSCTP